MKDPVAAALALPPGRHLIAVAGAPASGKSTYAHRLAYELTLAGRIAQVVPMDGFHLDNTILDGRGDRARKGAPHTFDARGFRRLLEDILNGGAVFLPLFDRARDLAIVAAGELSAETELVIVEGNYLLYDHPDWRDLARLWSLSIRLEVPLPILRTRLMQRWREHGLSGEDAIAKVRENDLPNGEEIAAHPLPADIVLVQER